MKIILTQKSIKENYAVKNWANTFNYIDKILIVLNATTGGVCIISHATVVGAPVGIASAGFIIVFFLATGIIKKIIKNNKKQKGKAS